MAKAKVSISDLRNRRIEAHFRKREAEAEIEAIDAQLLMLIPKGEQAEGMRHVYVEKETPAWKEISMKFIEDLIPKARHGVAEEIIASRTKKSTMEYILMLKEGM
jgi:TATA-binding protein-associated factor Taf7